MVGCRGPFVPDEEGHKQGNDNDSGPIGRSWGKINKLSRRKPKTSRMITKYSEENGKSMPQGHWW